MWITMLRIGKQVSSTMVVCSRHFTQRDFFFPELKCQRKRLKKTAIPTEDLPKLSTHDENKAARIKELSLARLAQRARRSAQVPYVCVEYCSKQTVALHDDSFYYCKCSRLKQSHSPVHRHPRKQFCSGKSASTSTDSSLTWGSSSLMVLCNRDTEIEHSFPMVLSSEGAENTDSSCTTAVQAPQFLTKHSEQERDIAGILLELGSLKRCTENKAVQVKSGGFPKRFADMVSDKNVTTFTGLPSGAVLNALVECYKKVRPLSGRQHMSAKERIVLTLMKLKHNISTAFLRHLFDTTITTCSSIIAETAQVLSEVLKSVVMLPQKRKLLNTCQSSSVM